ncbi:MAG: c-type cytochrome [Pseudomonadota bacterium]
MSTTLLGLIFWVGSPVWAQDISARLMACAACHGADGNAQLPNIPSLAGQPKVFIENQLVIIREGLREITAMKGLLDGVSDAEITAMAVHFSKLPARNSPTAADAALMARGKALAEGMRCGICHLPDYRGREQMPRLAGQREDYLLHSMLQFKNNQAIGRDTIMAASLYGISDGDLKALAHFLARVAP